MKGYKIHDKSAIYLPRQGVTEVLKIQHLQGFCPSLTNEISTLFPHDWTSDHSTNDIPSISVGGIV
jgi:hypothetical protein